jgi:preprotein translocase subunit YajC
MSGSEATSFLVYMVLIVGVFYFLWFRPQQTQRKKALEMLAALAPGDRVMTAGGLIGILRSIDGDVLDVEIAPGVVARFTKRAVIERLTEDVTTGDE